MKSILILLLICVFILCTQSDETKQTAKKLQIGIKKKVENQQTQTHKDTADDLVKSEIDLVVPIIAQKL